VTNEQVRLHQIFELVTAEVDSACGDGDGVVVFRKTNVQEVATEFEAWMAQNKWLAKNPYKRYPITENHVLFSDGSNENITFVSASEKEAARPGWEIEVWLEVW
jgi:hypothetical protein